MARPGHCRAPKPCPATAPPTQVGAFPVRCLGRGRRNPGKGHATYTHACTRTPTHITISTNGKGCNMQTSAEDVPRIPWHCLPVEHLVTFNPSRKWDFCARLLAGMGGGRLDMLSGSRASLSHSTFSWGTGSTPARQHVTQRESASTPAPGCVLASDALLT